MLDWVRFALTAALLLSGLFVLAVGVVGQFRFHYVLNRMHAASMGDSLGLLLTLLALCISCDDGATIAKLALVVAFQWFSSPTGAHLIARLEVSTDEGLSDEMEVRRL